jgi:hypothetical protein
MPGKITDKAMVSEIYDVVEILLSQYPDDINVSKLSDLIKRYIKKSGRKRTSRPVENTGLGMPRKLSQSMSVFMNIDESEKASRIEVNSFICKYIKNNDLQKSDQRKFFYLDENLAKVFGMPLKELISYQDLQKFLYKCFEQTPPTSPELQKDDSMSELADSLACAF